MKVKVYSQKGDTAGEVEVSDKVFGVPTNLHLLAEAVRIQLSNKRKGLAHTKTRGEVSGGGKKPWKQKGTGRARHGSTRSPIWRHGGIAFGPRSDRNWELKINKKAKAKALFISLSEKVRDGKLIVIDKIQLDKIKTKDFQTVIKSVEKTAGDFGKKQLFILPKADLTLTRASRNLVGFEHCQAKSLNVVDVLKADTIIALQDSLPVIEKTYLKETTK